MVLSQRETDVDSDENSSSQEESAERHKLSQRMVGQWNHINMSHLLMIQIQIVIIVKVPAITNLILTDCPLQFVGLGTKKILTSSTGKFQRCLYFISENKCLLFCDPNTL